MCSDIMYLWSDEFFNKGFVSTHKERIRKRARGRLQIQVGYSYTLVILLRVKLACKHFRGVG
jgi:hypothetical protein